MNLNVTQRTTETLLYIILVLEYLVLYHMLHLKKSTAMLKPNTGFLSIAIVYLE